MVNTNAFLEANWHRKNKHICQPQQWYQSKILGKPLRRMSQSEFAQRHIKREKEERIGVSNAQEYGHFANKCTSKKQWEPKVSLKYPEFIHFKTRGIIKGTDKDEEEDCKEQQSAYYGKDQSQVICYRCQSSGHHAFEYPNKNRKKHQVKYSSYKEASTSKLSDKRDSHITTSDDFIVIT
ncbi:hypothetical protein Tco_1166831 [Tanacetum coccineum]